jgi:hypothetical protein
MFSVAQWYSLARLRTHTESTRNALDAHTTTVGRRLRRFQQASATAFKTTETEREFDARRRRRDQAASSSGIPNPEPMARQSKGLSLNTFKLHSTGDYPQAIKLFGALDSFSSQNVRMSYMHFQSHSYVLTSSVIINREN